MKKVLLVFLFVFALPAFATGINGASAPCDNATLSKYTGTADIEINWEPNTINLNWYDGDTKLTVANSAQSCVYDSTLTVPPQPTKPGYTFNGWKVIHVPGGFTELQYLESTGTQWINTGVVKYTSGNIYRLASKVSWSDVSTRQIQGCQDAFYFGVVSGYLQMAQFAPNHTDIIISANTAYDIDATFNAINNTVSYSINGQSYTSSDVGYGPNYSGQEAGYTNSVDGQNFAVFSLNSHIWPFDTAKVYYYTLYKNGNMVRNMIPAKRNSDNVVGMYDTVTDTFFTNAGSGTFIAGPVAQ